MSSIAPGGCYPPHWPRPALCWPPYPPAPEPDPDSLDAVVDWMTYTHHELHRMVHNGLDLPGAMDVSAQWARLGDDLAEIGTALGEIVDQSATAWEGAAADLARQTIAALSHWAADTGVQATKVSACVTVEVQNATNARDEMPAPPYPIVDLPTPELPTPQPRQYFTQNDWEAAATITADQAVPLVNEKALHEQAARTMERFQASSREVYGTVPQFSPPQVGSPLVTLPDQPPPQQPPPPPTTPQGHVPAGPPGSAPPGAPAVTGAPGSTGTPVGAPTPPGARPTPGATDPDAQSRPPAATATPAAPGRSGHPGIGGGMPMAGAGGAGRDDDTERKGADYLKEEEDIWGANDTPTMPPVIGEDRRRA